MSVEIWFRDGFETEVVSGDLVSLTNQLNVSRANGHLFAILEDSQGKGVMVETQNIIRAREREDVDAFIG